MADSDGGLPDELDAGGAGDADELLEKLVQYTCVKNARPTRFHLTNCPNARLACVHQEICYVSLNEELVQDSERPIASKCSKMLKVPAFFLYNTVAPLF